MSNDYNQIMINQLAQVSGLSPENIMQLAAAISGSELSVDQGLISEGQYEIIGAQELRHPAANLGHLRLYKYFSDKDGEGGNYSRLALKNDTVHLSTPDIFNDPFDCLVNIDTEKAITALLQGFAKRFDIATGNSADPKDIAHSIANYLNNTRDDDLPHLASVQSDVFEIDCQLIYLSLLMAARQRGRLEPEDIVTAAKRKVEEQIAAIRKCRVACFTSHAYNLHMWSHYANEHRGFCVEFDVPETPSLVWNGLNEHQRFLLLNIFGVYYSPKRPDGTDLFIQMLLGKADSSMVSKLYAKVLCTKGPEWMLEQEYRLIVQGLDEPSDMPFFPVRAVYLGVRMPEGARREIKKMLAGTQVRIAQMRLSDRGYGLEAEWLDGSGSAPNE